MNRRNVLAGFAGAAAALPALALAQNVTAQKSEPIGMCHKADGGPRANFFPNFVLHTHENEKVLFYDDLVKGKAVVFNFFYVHCQGICPGITQNLKKVQKLLGDQVGRDIFIYSISLDPERDTPQMLKQYVAENKIEPGWTFLTGKPEEIEVLRRRLGFADIDPVVDREKANHARMIRYGNEKYDRWAACPALSHPHEIIRRLSYLKPLAVPTGKPTDSRLLNPIDPEWLKS